MYTVTKVLWRYHGTVKVWDGNNMHLCQLKKSVTFLTSNNGETIVFMEAPWSIMQRYMSFTTMVYTKVPWYYHMIQITAPYYCHSTKDLR